MVTKLFVNVLAGYVTILIQLILVSIGTHVLTLQVAWQVNQLHSRAALCSSVDLSWVTWQ